MSDIMTTSFPAHKSQDVGDAMITRSTMELIRVHYKAFDPTIVYREKSLNGFTKKHRHNVVLPGFSLANNTYPHLYPLFDDLERMRNFFPLGCSYQSSLPGMRAFTETPYNKDTLAFLNEIALQFGPFPCRDQLIVDRLTQFGIPAFYMGDLVLFDDKEHKTEPRLPKKINAVAITLQHHVRYLEHVIDLMKRVKARFPQARTAVTMHSVKRGMYQILEVRAKELGFEVLELGGPAENLQAYADFDLHIGYRLHGHIYFLRKRKPTILLNEDNRAYGFSRTAGTAFGTIDACHEQSNSSDEQAVERAMAFLEDQLDTNFAGYQAVFDFIDDTYANIVKPHFAAISACLAATATTN